MGAAAPTTCIALALALALALQPPGVSAWSAPRPAAARARLHAPLLDGGARATPVPPLPPRQHRPRASIVALAEVAEALGPFLPSDALAAAASPLSLTAWDPTGLVRWGWWAIIAWMFAAQAKVCDEFFVPAIEACCRKFAIPEDVAGATLMAFGCNGPELFVNAISIFVTHSDVGVGTIVGSEIFNLLCIVGGAALVAPIEPLPIERSSFTRDSLFYGLAAVLLGVVVYDGQVTRAESLALVVMAGIYALAVKETDSVLRRLGVQRCAPGMAEAEAEAEAEADGPTPSEYAECRVVCGVAVTEEALARTDFVCAVDAEAARAESGEEDAPWKEPLERAGRLLEASLGPFGAMLDATVPDCKDATAETDEKWLPAFAISMGWLAVCSLAVCVTADQLTVDFGIPSAVIGLTVAAAGTSFANLMSSLIESRRGRTEMAVANALGSNIQNVFLALGVPWALYLCLVSEGGAPLAINASGIGEGVAIMLGTLGGFAALTLAGNFTLSKVVGRGAIAAYGAYLIFTCAPLLMQQS